MIESRLIPRYLKVLTRLILFSSFWLRCGFLELSLPFQLQYYYFDGLISRFLLLLQLKNLLLVFTLFLFFFSLVSISDPFWFTFIVLVIINDYYYDNIYRLWRLKWIYPLCNCSFSDASSLKTTTPFILQCSSFSYTFFYFWEKHNGFVRFWISASDLQALLFWSCPSVRPSVCSNN